METTNGIRGYTAATTPPAPTQLNLSQINELIRSVRTKLAEADLQLSKLTGNPRPMRVATLMTYSSIDLAISALEELRSQYRQVKEQIDGNQFVTDEKQFQTIKAIADELNMPLPGQVTPRVNLSA